MPFGALRVRAIVSAIGLSVAVVTTVSVPAGYAIVEYLAQATALSFKAELNAARVAKYAYAHDLWRFHRVRIEELIELPLHRGEAIAQKVLETDGSEVAALDLGVKAPRSSRRAPIILGGEVVGFHEVAASLRPLLFNTLLIAVFSSCLGFFAYFAVRVFPLKVLDRTFDKLQTANRHVAEMNAQLEERVEARTKELHEAQAILLRQERLSALGQLTATVAHELRNPLGVIRNSLSPINEIVADKRAQLERPLARIERSVERCNRIITDLLDYSRPRALQRVETDIDEWLTSVVREQTVPPTIQVRLDCQPLAKRTSFDPERLRQVVINLFENAVQALADKPTGGDAPAIHVRLTASEAAVEVEISDNGGGIPANVLPKIFEPLFSTKSFGTGLGLPAVKQIVEAHGGSIEVTSQVGQGTAARVRLPLTHAQQTA